MRSRKRRLVHSGCVRSPSPARVWLRAACRAFSFASMTEALLLDAAGEEARGRDGDFDFAGEAARAGDFDFAGEAARERAGDFAARRGEAAVPLGGICARGAWCAALWWRGGKHKRKFRRR